MHIMFCSAIPTSMKRSGKRSAKKCTIVDSARSPTSTTMRGSCSPRSTSARPKPSRVFFISTFSGSAIVMVMGASVGEQPGRPFGVAGAQLLQRHFRLVHLGRLAVPAVVVRHVRHALPHHGVGEDHARLAPVRARGGERLEQRGNVVARALDHVPVERAPLVAKRLDSHDVLHVAIDLLAVVVDDPAQVVELVVRGEHRRLPDLPLLLLAVPHHAVDPARVLVDARGHRHPAAHRESLPERAGRHLDAGRVVLRGVALRVAIEGAELHQVPEREVATLGHQRVDDRGDMADREVPEIPLRPLGIGGIHVQLVEEQHRAELGRGERTAGVTGLGLGQQRDDVAADLERHAGQPFRRPGQSATGVGCREIVGGQRVGGQTHLRAGAALPMDAEGYTTGARRSNARAGKSYGRPVWPAIGFSRGPIGSRARREKETTMALQPRLMLPTTALALVLLGLLWNSLVPATVSAQGKLLQWDSCSPGTRVKNFACTSNEGFNDLFATFYMTSLRDGITGFFAELEFGGGDRHSDGSLSGPDFDPLPSFWHLQSPEGCRTGAQTILIGPAPSGCVDPYAGQYATPSIFMTYPYIPSAGATPRLLVQVAASWPERSMCCSEFYAFHVRVSNVRATGEGACEGCCQPMTAWLKTMYLTRSNGTTLGLATDRTVVAWNESASPLCGVT